MRTWVAKPDEIERKWWIVDASDKTLGRLSTQLATILRGKNKPQFTPHVDTGDFVVVINSDRIKVTGKKLEQKKYYRTSRFFGSLKEMTAKELLEKDSTEVIRKAVRGMLPRNKLSTELIKKLKIYSGSDHPHSAQKPQALI